MALFNYLSLLLVNTNINSKKNKEVRGMLKFKKIEDKTLVKVQAQANCTAAGHSYKYEGQGDCLNDCVQWDKPRYYASKTH